MMTCRTKINPAPTAPEPIRPPQPTSNDDSPTRDLNSRALDLKPVLRCVAAPVFFGEVTI